MNIIEKDKAYVWHPFTPQKNMQSPIAIIKGKNTLLFDEENNTYIDAISSWWVTLHGHGNKYIAKAIYQQALTIEQVIFAGFTHAPAVNLAQQLLPILPGKMHKIFYSDNGSTSTEVALKMAIQYWWNIEGKDTKRKKIIAFNNAYHGDTFGAMSVSDRSVFTLAFQQHLFEVIFIDAPTEHNIENLFEVIELHKNDIAAFIYEPLVQGAGGIKMYAAQCMDSLLQKMKQYQIICIADEVMTGFGRTGTLFASEQLITKPDIICLSKGLTGGTMALGVTACNENIYNAFVTDNKLQTFFHGHSFTANPLACTAALASLHLLLQQKTLKKITWITDENKRVAASFSAYNFVKNIRCLGTILAFEIVIGEDAYLNSISQTVTNFCMKKGVFIRPLGNTFYWMPPYCITKQEFAKMFKTTHAMLLHLQKMLPNN